MKGVQIREFAVLSFTRESVRGILFRRRGARCTVERHFIEIVDPADPAEAWKRGLKILGRGKECPLYLTGPLADGIFFRCESIALPPRAMREALEFELPQRMLRVPDDVRFQFVAGEADAEGNVPVNVYALPASSLNHPAAMLTQAGGRADEIVFPLLSLSVADPPAYLSRFEKDFRFADGEWQPLQNSTDLEPWKKILGTTFDFGGNDKLFDDFTECFMVARLILSQDFRSRERGLELLPVELRPRRYRNQLRITALLGILLAGAYLWSWGGVWSSEYRNFRAVVEERNNIRAENTRHQARLKVMDKEQKELARVVNLKAGEPKVVEKIATLTGLLPSNVMVSSFRLAEGSLDLVLMSEAESLDLPALLKRVPYWKIGQLQQRRMGDSANSITLKLVPAEEGKK